MWTIISGILHLALCSVLNRIVTATFFVSLLVLSLSVFVDDFFNHAQANKHVDPGISIGSHVWCDEMHIVGKQVIQVDGRPREAQGVFIYLDVTRPAEAVTIDLSSYGQIRGVHPSQVPFCHNQELLFYSFPGGPREQLYHLFIGGDPPELLADVAYGGDPSQMFTDGALYIIAGAEPSEGGMSSDSHHPIDNCPVTYIKPGYRVVCVDRLNAGNRAMPKAVLDSWPLLRDPNYKVIANLLDDPVYQIPKFLLTQRFDISPDGAYLYTECQTDSSSRDIRYCRYRLDGNKNQWEELFLFWPKLHDWNILAGHSPGIVYATNSGDVFFAPWRHVFIMEGLDIMWRWSAGSHAFSRIPHLDAPTAWSFSPSGKRMSFSDHDYRLALHDLTN
jgi:hypothetical protein